MQRLRQITDKLYQGAYPESLNYGVDFDVIINVSDCCHASLNNESPEFYKKPVHYWFPQNEWGLFHYETFYGVKRALDRHKEDVCLVHCCSGVNRSCKAVYGYLLSHNMEGLFPEHEAQWRRFVDDGGEGVTKCPPYIEEFLRRMNEYPTYSVGGILSQMMGKQGERMDDILIAIGVKKRKVDKKVSVE